LTASLIWATKDSGKKEVFDIAWLPVKRRFPGRPRWSGNLHHREIMFIN
jgi:hypothetical protein